MTRCARLEFRTAARNAPACPRPAFQDFTSTRSTAREDRSRFCPSFAASSCSPRDPLTVLAGIDLGGTQVRVALARSDGNLVASVKTKPPSLGSPQAMVDWAAAEIDKHRGREKVGSITIAAPGPIDLKQGVLVNPPNLPWKNVPLAAMLARATGAKVQLANDADMAGLGEFHRGAGRGTRNMVYITWSTGVGGGLIIDGKLHRGAHGSAGEVGHMIIDPNGPMDTCGQRGCLGAFIGGANLARQTGHPPPGLFPAPGQGAKPAQSGGGRAA